MLTDDYTWSREHALPQPVGQKVIPVQERAYTALDRVPEDGEIDRIVAALAQAAADDDIERGFLTEDTSAERHREHNLGWFRRAHLDEELAVGLYELNSDSVNHSFYVDVALFLDDLRDWGTAVAVVSDIHFDLRPEFEAADLDRHIDTYVLSFEQGVQKPDPRIFQLALDRLGVKPSAAVIFGDRARRDGGAAALGIVTVIQPLLLSWGSRGLGRFLTLFETA